MPKWNQVEGGVGCGPVNPFGASDSAEQAQERVYRRRRLRLALMHMPVGDFTSLMSLVQDLDSEQLDAMLLLVTYAARDARAVSE